ncbi:MAG TPA: twin-arginine translocase subunit TatC [Candidatus Excrementavichristensenella intestinipullorum]|nr:twin-arginine translocase subunit TatC [Candidatus Excrementavichristensenella intestinipullorum]
MQHVLALRRVLLISVGAAAAGFLLSFYFLRGYIMDFISRPIEAKGITLIYTAVSEALVTQLKVSLVAGIVLASPVIVWQIWSFIKPALYDHEQKTFRRWFFVALVLFLLGIVFCYLSVYPMAMNFFLVEGEGVATPMLSIDKYVGFLMGFLLPFGLTFQLPVVIYLTTRVGLTTVEMLTSKRKYVILAVAVIAAILTPPDVVSQILLALPMLLLYEVGVLIARVVKPGVGRERAAAQEEKEDA